MGIRPSPSRAALSFSSRVEKSNNRLWGSHVRVPETVASKIMEGGSRRVVCRLNDSAERQCALLPVGNGSFVVTVNRAQLKELHLEVGAAVRVTLRKDKSPYGLPMPQELTELFLQDAEGKTFFHALSQGRQRTLLYIIGRARTPEDRASRAVIVIRHLRENAGVIDYRRLSVLLKKGRIRLGGT